MSLGPSYYDKVCTRCGELYSFTLKTRNDKTADRRKYCSACLGDVLRLAGQRTRRGKARYISTQGYVYIRPEGSTQAMTEHKYVMERMLGRPMVKGESVHHKNGVRTDNRPENLELWVGAIRNGQRAADVVCQSCGAPYLAGKPE
jgi:hypothetical protein